MKAPFTTDREHIFYCSALGHTFYCSPLGAHPRALDLGTNHGRFSQEMNEQFGADVRMVEANPKLHADLASLGRFPVYHCAVTDEDGSIRFNVAQNDAGSSILALPAESEYNCVLRETVMIPSRTVASLLREIGWDRVDLIKSA